MINIIQCFACIGALAVLCGCQTYQKDDFIGAWGGEESLQIITPAYMLVLPSKKTFYYPSKSHGKENIYKINYQILPCGRTFIIKSAGFGKLKKDSIGFYLDHTPYWLGFIPTDNYAISRKISDVEAKRIFFERGITGEDIRYLPIIDKSEAAKGKGLVLIPDNTIPEIFATQDLK